METLNLWSVITIVAVATASVVSFAAGERYARSDDVIVLAKDDWRCADTVTYPTVIMAGKVPIAINNEDCNAYIKKK